MIVISGWVLCQKWGARLPGESAEVVLHLGQRSVSNDLVVTKVLRGKALEVLGHWVALELVSDRATRQVGRGLGLQHDVVGGDALSIGFHLVGERRPGGSPLLGSLDVGRPGLVLVEALKRLFRIENIAEVSLGISRQFVAGIVCVLNPPAGLCVVLDNTVMRLGLLFLCWLLLLVLKTIADRG